MRDGKAFASLSSGLLARKGQARPAMRPQGFAPSLHQQDDLGWNDMGHDVPRVAGAVLPVELAGPSSAPSAAAVAATVVELPQVIRQQEEIAREFARAAEPVLAEPALTVPIVAEPEPEPVAVAPVPAPAPEPAPVAAAPKRVRRPASSKVAGLAPRTATHRAAFTLRLDSDRHLLLRLACAVQHRSAQQIVIEALDRLLADLPDVARLAASLPSKD